MPRSSMRRFQLRRIIDHSGVAGKGIIAEGIIFTSGVVVMSWVVKPAGMTRVPKGLAVYEDVPHLLAVHGHGGDTVVMEYLDCQDCGSDISGWASHLCLLQQLHALQPLPGRSPAAP